jgi:hypothetical protein
MKGKYIVIGVVIVLLLGGAAFMAGRLLQKSAQTEEVPQGMIGPNGEVIAPGISSSSGGGGESSTMASVSVRMEPAQELPATDPNVRGQLRRVEDNSIFVKDIGGGGMVVATMGDDGELTIDSPGSEGTDTEIEIVVTQDTQIYREVTEMLALDDGDSDTPATVQQKVEPTTLDDIGDQGLITAWGQKRGDRLIAEVVVYMGF